MEVQPIPIETLSPGDFYDMKSGEDIEGILLLDLLPSNTGKLLLMHKHSMEITVRELGRIYPYRAFTSSPNNVLMLYNKFPDAGLIDAIGREMLKALAEDDWVRVLPHFYQGYLHLYLSIATFDGSSPKQNDRLFLVFDFISAFLTAYTNNRTHLKSYSDENKGFLHQNVKEMVRIAEAVDLYRQVHLFQDCFKDRITEIKKTKEDLISALRPLEMSAKEFDKMWSWVARNCSSEVVALESSGTLSLRNLLLTTPNLIDRISSDDGFFQMLSDIGFPGLSKEEVVTLKIRIAVLGLKKSSHSFANQIIENLIRSSQAANHVSLTQLCAAFLEENLQEKLIQSPNKLLKQYIFTKAEMFPVVVTHLKHELGCKIPLNFMLECVAKRIAQQDWEFINYVITHKVLITKIDRSSVSGKMLKSLTKEILIASRKHHMDKSLLKDLLPYADYGLFMFPLLTHSFTVTSSKQTLIAYFGSEGECKEMARKHLYVFRKARINLWYIFAGSVWIQFLWVRRFVPGLGERLSGNLAREICAYIT